MQAVTDKNQISIVQEKETQLGVFISTCLVQPITNVYSVNIINITEETVSIKVPYVNIEALEEESKTGKEVASVNIKEKNFARREKLREALRAKHLNKEKRETLYKICKEYQDVFHLARESLTKTSTVNHRIAIKSDTALIKLYKLPQKHKQKEMRQIKEMLDSGIIHNSKSHWNAPLLFVPKKRRIRHEKIKNSCGLSAAKQSNNRRLFSVAKYRGNIRPVKKREVLFHVKFGIRVPQDING